MREVTFKTHYKVMFSGDIYTVIISFNCEHVIVCAKQRISIIRMKNWIHAHKLLIKRGLLFSSSAQLKLLNFNDLHTIRNAVKFDW